MYFDQRILRYIADASTGTCHCRDKIWSYSLSILQNTYSSYVWILLLRHIADATTVTCHCWDEIRSRSQSCLVHHSSECWTGPNLEATESPKGATSGKGKGSVTNQPSEAPSAAPSTSAPTANPDPCASTRQNACSNGGFECDECWGIPLFDCCNALGDSETSEISDGWSTFFAAECQN